MKKKEKKEISSRNYFIVIVVSILTIVIVLYIRSFIINYRANVSDVSVLHTKVSEVNINELDYYTNEATDSILYFSYTGDKDVYNMEKKLLKEIEKKGLTEKIIYVDITELLTDYKYINILKEKFPNVKDQINKAPIFIYIKSGQAVEAFSSELKMLDYKMLNKIVNKYEIE